MSSETVRGLQERAARALPAEHVEDAGGWCEEIDTGVQIMDDVLTKLA